MIVDEKSTELATRWTGEACRRLRSFFTLQAHKNDSNFFCSMDPTATSYVAFSESPLALCLETELTNYNPRKAYEQSLLLRQVESDSCHKVVDKEFFYDKPVEEEAKIDLTGKECDEGLLKEKKDVGKIPSSSRWNGRLVKPNVSNRHHKRKADSSNIRSEDSISLDKFREEGIDRNPEVSPKRFKDGDDDDLSNFIHDFIRQLEKQGGERSALDVAKQTDEIKPPAAMGRNKIDAPCASNVHLDTCDNAGRVVSTIELQKSCPPLQNATDTDSMRLSRYQKQQQSLAALQASAMSGGLGNSRDSQKTPHYAGYEVDTIDVVKAAERGSFLARGTCFLGKMHYKQQIGADEQQGCGSFDHCSLSSSGSCIKRGKSLEKHLESTRQGTIGNDASVDVEMTCCETTESDQATESSTSIGSSISATSCGSNLTGSKESASFLSLYDLLKRSHRRHQILLQSASCLQSSFTDWMSDNCDIQAHTTVKRNTCPLVKCSQTEAITSLK